MFEEVEANEEVGAVAEAEDEEEAEDEAEVGILRSRRRRRRININIQKQQQQQEQNRITKTMMRGMKMADSVTGPPEKKTALLVVS